MGAFLSSQTPMERSVGDFFGTVQKDGFKLQFPSFHIKPSFDDSSSQSPWIAYSPYNMISQWVTLLIILIVTYLLFVNRTEIQNYISKLDPDQFKEDFRKFRSDAASKVTGAGSFVKENIVDELASAGKSSLSAAYSGAKTEVGSVGKDVFSFIKTELFGSQGPSTGVTEEKK